MKMWETNEYPQLAANEYFCLTVARKYGLDAPTYRLAEDGMALVIEVSICAWTGPTADLRTSAC